MEEMNPYLTGLIAPLTPIPMKPTGESALIPGVPPTDFDLGQVDRRHLQVEGFGHVGRR